MTHSNFIPNDYLSNWLGLQFLHISSFFYFYFFIFSVTHLIPHFEAATPAKSDAHAPFFIHVLWSIFSKQMTNVLPYNVQLLQQGQVLNLRLWLSEYEQLFFFFFGVGVWGVFSHSCFYKRQNVLKKKAFSLWIQFNSKNSVHPTWGDYITLRRALEEDEIRMDGKLRQGYKHAVFYCFIFHNPYGYKIHNNTLLPNTNINAFLKHILQHVISKCQISFKTAPCQLIHFHS